MAIPAASHVVYRPNVPRLPPRLLVLASDERLVGLVRGGSEPAFEVIFDRHHRALLAFCRHMLGSAEEAEDAVQHTLAAAYKSLLGSEKPIDLKPWLYTIARNRCLTLLRARRERPVGDLPEPATEHLSTQVLRREELRMLLGDLAALPEDQRAALVLAAVANVTYEEIAVILGCPPGKVKALIFQARTSLLATRTARETPCPEIREQLASLSGGALRRNTLRRHLRECEGCRQFRSDMRTQKHALAIVLPVVPTLGLKEAVMSSACGGGAAAGGGGAIAAGGTAAVTGGGGAIAASGGAVATTTGGGLAAAGSVTAAASTGGVAAVGAGGAAAGASSAAAVAAAGVASVGVGSGLAAAGGGGIAKALVALALVGGGSAVGVQGVPHKSGLPGPFSAMAPLTTMPAINAPTSNPFTESPVAVDVTPAALTAPPAPATVAPAAAAAPAAAPSSPAASAAPDASGVQPTTQSDQAPVTTHPVAPPADTSPSTPAVTAPDPDPATAPATETAPASAPVVEQAAPVAEAPATAPVEASRPAVAADPPAADPVVTTDPVTPVAAPDTAPGNGATPVAPVVEPVETPAAEPPPVEGGP